MDAEYTRIESGTKGTLVQKLTMMPWGNRSLLLRDPDGMLINLFALVTAEAERRLDRR